MSRAARTARTPSSPTTAAATGIAPSVRAPPPSNGSPSARPSCCPSATSTSCSRCRGRSPISPTRTRPRSTTLLFKAAAEATLTIAADPKHLGARIGITAVLHTWGSAMTHHPHLHMIVPGGGLSARRPALDRVPADVLPPRARALAPVPPALPEDARSGAQGRPPRLLRRPRRTRRDTEHSPPSSRRCARPSGWSMPRGRSAGRRPCSPICRATPTASPSPIAG